MTRGPAPARTGLVVGTVLLVGAAVVEQAPWTEPLALAADVLAGGAFAVLAVAAVTRSPRYAVICAAASTAWFVGDLVEGLVWVHRPLLLLCVLSFPDGQLYRRFAGLMVGALTVCSVVPGLAGRPLVTVLAGVGIAVYVAAGLVRAGAVRVWDGGLWLGGARVGTGRVGTGRGATGRVGTGRIERARAAAAMALAAALLVPAVGLVQQVLLNTGLATGLTILYSLLVALSGGILLLEYLTAGDVGDTDSVITLSEVDAAATVAALKVQAREPADAATRRALAAAIHLLERNTALQTDLAAAIDEVRASRRRLVEVTTGERAALRQRLAERALPAIPAVAGLLRAVHGDADPAASRLIVQCCDELEEIAADIENLSRGLHPRGLTERGLSALGEIAEACPIPSRSPCPRSGCRPRWSRRCGTCARRPWPTS